MILFILWKILDRLFFRPLGKVIGEREGKITSDKQTLQGLTARIEEMNSSLDLQLRQAGKESSRIKEELIQKGESLRREMIENTRGDASKMFGNKMAELERQIVAAEKELQKEIHLFTDKLRESILA